MQRAERKTFSTVVAIRAEAVYNGCTITIYIYLYLYIPRVRERKERVVRLLWSLFQKDPFSLDFFFPTNDPSRSLSFSPRALKLPNIYAHTRTHQGRFSTTRAVYGAARRFYGRSFGIFFFMKIYMYGFFFILFAWGGYYSGVPTTSRTTRNFDQNAHKKKSRIRHTGFFSLYYTCARVSHGRRVVVGVSERVGWVFGKTVSAPLSSVTLREKSLVYTTKDARSATAWLFLFSALHSYGFRVHDEISTRHRKEMKKIVQYTTKFTPEFPYNILSEMRETSILIRPSNRSKANI